MIFLVVYVVCYHPDIALSPAMKKGKNMRDGG